MLVKTNHNNIFHQPVNNYMPDNIIAISLDESDILRKNELLGDVYNEKVFYGDIGRILFALLI